MLRKILLFAALPLVIFSCDKEDDINTGYRTPTCEDTSDDGKFEAFNAPESSRFLQLYGDVPANEDGSLVDSVRVTAHKLVNNSNDFIPAFLYKQKKPTAFWGYLIYGDGEFYSWTRNSVDVDSTISIPIHNMRNLNLQEGCYRFYYVFSDTGYKKVFTKGHYDIEVRNLN